MDSYHQKYMLQRHPRLCSMLDIDPSGDELMTSHELTRLNGYLGGCGTANGFAKERLGLDISDKCAEYVSKNLSKVVAC